MGIMQNAVGTSMWVPDNQADLSQISEALTSPLGSMPNPTQEMLADPRFEAIWQTIKSWDLNVPEYYGGYCGANGSHAALIFNALFAPKPSA